MSIPRIVVTQTQASPSHLHCNAMTLSKNREARKVYEDIVERIKQEPRQPVKKQPIKVVAFSTYKGNKTPLEISASVLGVDLDVIRSNKATWINRRKTQYALEYLKRSSDGIYMFTDSKDAVLVRPVKDIEKVFLEQNKDVLVSAEKNAYPPEPQLEAKESSRARLGTPWKFGNSGGIIGYRDALIKLYTEASNYRCGYKGGRYARSDQYGIRIAVINQGLTLDEECRVFYTFNMYKPGELEIS